MALGPLARRVRGAAAAAVHRPALGVGTRADALLGLARADLGDALRVRHFQPLGRRALVVEVGHGHARQPPADRLLDRAQIPFFLRRHQRESRAGHFSARGAADAVDVVLGLHRHVEVDHVAERCHVDAARGDVGRDQHLVAPLLEPFERLRALRLRAVAVDALNAHLVRRQVLRETVGTVLGSREHQRVLHFALQQLEQQRRLERLQHRVDRLRDPRRRLRAPLQVDRHRRVQHLLRQLRDRRRHRRAEEQRLPLLRDVPQHAADVGEEAHVEHPIRFVEDEEFDAVQLRVRRAEVIEQAPGGADDNVDAAAEGVLLRPHADAAEDRGAVDRRVDGEVLEVLEDLRRQLTRRRDDQRARRPARLADQLVEDRQQTVLPLPVMAQARTSLPSSAGGMASAWIGVGRAKPRSLRPRRRSG